MGHVVYCSTSTRPIDVQACQGTNTHSQSIFSLVATNSLHLSSWSKHGDLQGVIATQYLQAGSNAVICDGWTASEVAFEDDTIGLVVLHFGHKEVKAKDDVSEPLNDLTGQLQVPVLPWLLCARWCLRMA